MDCEPKVRQFGQVSYDHVAGLAQQQIRLCEVKRRGASQVRSRVGKAATNCQARHPFEVTDIPANELEPVVDGGGGDLQICIGKGCPNRFKRRS